MDSRHAARGSRPGGVGARLPQRRQPVYPSRRSPNNEEEENEHDARTAHGGRHIGGAESIAPRHGYEMPARDTRKVRLQKLLFDTIVQMDEEGLVFLLRQAHILSSRANTERINREIEAFERDRGPVTEPEPEPTGTASIELAPDGKSYFLAIGGARKALTREELGGIVRVCLGAVDRDVGVRNLFKALGRERATSSWTRRSPGRRAPTSVRSTTRSWTWRKNHSRDEAPRGTGDHRREVPPLLRADPHDGARHGGRDPRLGLRTRPHRGHRSGGFIPARILRTFLEKPILTVGIAYYDAENRPSKTPRMIQWIDEVEKKLHGRRILLVDEVDDSRVTLEYCLRELLRHGPAEIAVAVLHNKRKEKRGSLPKRSAATGRARSSRTAGSAYPWDALDIERHERLSNARVSGVRSRRARAGPTRADPATARSRSPAAPRSRSPRTPLATDRQPGRGSAEIERVLQRRRTQTGRIRDVDGSTSHGSSWS